MFAPKFAGSILKYTGYELQQAGFYTPNELKAFWDNILHSDASKKSW